MPQTTFIQNMDLDRIEIDKVLELAHDEKTEYSLARKLIENSVYWDHPNGELCRASNHSKRIYKSESESNNWKINFGNHTFLISKAVSRCQSVLIDFFDVVESGGVMDISEVVKSMQFKISGSVINLSGGYEIKYPIHYAGYMAFGTQLISTYEFIKYLLKQCKTYEKPVRTMICPYCYKPFSNKLELKRHENVFHYR